MPKRSQDVKIILKKIKITNLKLFSSIEINFANNYTIITGNNGTGKTTLLESINFLKKYEKMRLEIDDFYYKMVHISPSIEYHLNPAFFGFENISVPIIIQVNPNKFELINKSDYDSKKILKTIKSKLDILFLDENFPMHIPIPTYLSRGESLSIQLKELEDFSTNFENKLILIDCFDMYLDESRKLEFYNIIEKLAKKNQVILATQRPPFNVLNKYNVITLSRDQQLTHYLVETVRGNSKFYDTFIESIENIKELMEISVPSINLHKTYYNMLYLNVIISMETYLSDAFINTVINSDDLIRKMLKNTTEFKQRKFKLSDLLSWLDDMKKSAVEYLLEIIYHKIWKVKDIYENVLEIDFPEDINEIQKAVMIRHDIVHRNGKTREGIEIVITKEHIEQIIKKIEGFIKHIDDQLINLAQK